MIQHGPPGPSPLRSQTHGRSLVAEPCPCAAAEAFRGHPGPRRGWLHRLDRRAPAPRTAAPGGAARDRRRRRWEPGRDMADPAGTADADPGARTRAEPGAAWVRP